MKRIFISLVLLACFLLPLGGAFTVLMVRRQTVRREVKQRLVAGLDRNELVQFRFSGEDLRELKFDAARREFEKDGLMFDVVYSALKKDTTQFWCWPDHQETSLNKRLDELASKAFGSDKKSKQVQNDLNHFFAFLFYEGKKPLLHHLVATDLYFRIQNSSGASMSISADTPPPRG